MKYNDGLIWEYKSIWLYSIVAVVVCCCYCWCCCCCCGLSFYFIKVLMCICDKCIKNWKIHRLWLRVKLCVSHACAMLALWNWTKQSNDTKTNFCILVIGEPTNCICVCYLYVTWALIHCTYGNWYWFLLIWPIGKKQPNVVAIGAIMDSPI